MVTAHGAVLKVEILTPTPIFIQVVLLLSKRELEALRIFQRSEAVILSPRS